MSIESESSTADSARGSVAHSLTKELEAVAKGTNGTSVKLAQAAGTILLLVFVGQGVMFIRANSQTFDEAIHLVSGYSYLTTPQFRMFPQNPPLVPELSALPVYLWYRRSSRTRKSGTALNATFTATRSANGYSGKTSSTTHLYQQIES